MKTIGIVIPTFNEVDNVNLVYEAVLKTLPPSGAYKYQVLFIDNASDDGTQEKLIALAKADPSVQVIINTTNYGPVRSPFYGLMSVGGDAAILMAADLQEPPELIPKFIAEWEQGHQIVAGIKETSEERAIMFKLRQAYYDTLSMLSEVKLLKQFTGFALYDRSVIEILRECQDPYPYLRGLISELGYTPKEVIYHQPKRLHGYGKGRFFNMMNFALLGLVNHSRAPLRLSILAGAVLGLLSLLVAFIYFIYKLVFWNQFQVGMAPLIIGLFFFSSVQLFSLGIVGEYIGAILVQVKKRPYVIEKDRINF